MVAVGEGIRNIVFTHYSRSQQSMSEALRTASLNPDDAVQGGLLDDADVEIVGARFDIFTYSTGQTGVGAIINFRDAEEKIHEQFYSAGQSDRYVPSDDKTKLLLTGTATGLNQSSNLVAYLSSLVNAGVPKPFFSDSIGVMVGMKLHVNRVNQPGRAVLAGSESAEGGRPKTILLATKLLSMPGEKTGKAATKATAKATPGAAPVAASAEVSTELSDKAVQYIFRVSEKPVLRQKISTLVFQAANTAKDADKQALTKIVFDESWLTANSGRPVEDADNGVVAFDYDAATKTLSRAA
jgi:hypothetical protein